MKSRIIRYLSNFHMIWLFFGMFVIACILNCFGYVLISRICFTFSLALFVLFLIGHPMNVFYGLNGTSGNISYFLVSIIVVNLFFFCIYYWGFIKHSGINYDVNQPYVSYGMFFKSDSTCCVKTYTIIDTIPEHYSYCINKKTLPNGTVQIDTSLLVMLESYSKSYESHTYQRVSWWAVLQNAFMTSLIQEPTELFSNYSVYNDIQKVGEQNLNGYNDKVCCRFFNWILTLHVFISWIFFGVFISILYNKFRHES